MRSRSTARLPVWAVLLVLGAGAAGYAWLRDADAWSAGVNAPQITPLMPRSSPHPDGGAMVARLAGRLQQKPDDVEGWTMLARSYAALGRFDEALAAHRRLLELRPADAQALADYADTLGVANGRNLSGAPERLLGEALQLDPDNVKALALAGKLAFERGDAVTASHRWERALRHTDPHGEVARQLRAALEVAGRRSAPSPMATAAR